MSEIRAVSEMGMNFVGQDFKFVTSKSSKKFDHKWGQAEAVFLVMWDPSMNKL
jgi:hypothetical protein